MSKKGLAVIYDPHNVYQFLWYYCTYGKKIDWYALCLPNSYKGEYLSKECKKLNIFKEIYSDSIPFDSLSLKKKIGLFLKMFCYAVFGRQKAFAKKMIASYINGLDFDTAVILTDVGFISGMFCLLGDEKEISILEDGQTDYVVRKYSNIFKHITNFYDVQGFFLSLLGYSNTGHYFPLCSTKKCIKYSSLPDKMQYTRYKEIRTLFDMRLTEIPLFNSLVSKIYPNISNYFMTKDISILFTTPLNDFSSDNDYYIHQLEKYINSNCKNLLLKRHPRDKTNYSFLSSVSVSEIPQNIPAEILLPYLSGSKIVFMSHSSINLYMKQFCYHAFFLYFKSLYKISKKEKNIISKYPKYSDFCKEIDFFDFNHEIIVLE
ncbi:MAG: glycosyltransferase family 52 [Spirochaetales bacterium]|nr:glycosyltransferase family 52 [Spirochaetales bacterium]